MPTTTLRVRARPEAIDVAPGRAALIVVDMQNAYLSSGGYLDLAGFDLTGADEVIRRSRAVLSAARQAGVEVIYLQNGWDPDYREAGGPQSPNPRKSNAMRVMRERPELWGSLLARGGWDYELVEDIAPARDELVIAKPRYSGFVNTPLDSILRSRGVSHLFFIGVATNVCVETTVRDAFGLEYHAVVIADCTLQAGPPSAQEASLFNIERFFGWVSDSESFVAAAMSNAPAGEAAG